MKVPFLFKNLITLTLFVGLSLTACSDKNEEATGTTDGGGGNTIKSSPEEVKATIEQVREDIRLKLNVDSQKIEDLAAFSYQFKIYSNGDVDQTQLYEKGTYSPEGVDYQITTKDLATLFEVINPQLFYIRKHANNNTYRKYSHSFNLDAPENSELVKNLGNYPESVAQLISKSTFVFKEKGACEAANKPNGADASVSENKIGAEVCWSIERLRNVDSSILYPTIASLWFHEMAHMLGKSEEEAVRIQKIVFGLTFSGSLRDGVFMSNEAGLEVSKDRLIRITDEKKDRMKKNLQETLAHLNNYFKNGSYSAKPIYENSLALRDIQNAYSRVVEEVKKSSMVLEVHCSDLHEGFDREGLLEDLEQLTEDLGWLHQYMNDAYLHTTGGEVTESSFQKRRLFSKEIDYTAVQKVETSIDTIKNFGRYCD